jgi:integrase
MLNRAVEWNVIATHPLSKFKKLAEGEYGIVRYLEEEEEQQLREALDARQNDQRAERLRYIEWCIARHHPPPKPFNNLYTDYLKPLVLVALNTGLRRGELFNLSWDDIDLKRRILSVCGGEMPATGGSGTKNGRTRHVPLNDEAFATLNAWAQQNKAPVSKLIFLSPVMGERFDNINSAWRALIQSANIKAFRFHDLRHTFASNLAMCGVDLYTVKELLGHSSIEMTQRYAHLSPDHKSAAVALLNNHRADRPLTTVTCQSTLTIARESMH